MGLPLLLLLLPHKMVGTNQDLWYYDILTLLNVVLTAVGQLFKSGFSFITIHWVMAGFSHSFSLFKWLWTSNLCY